MGGRGSGGHNRLSEAQRLARGTWRRDRSETGQRPRRGVAQLLEIRAGDEPEPPAWMSAAESRVWRAAVEELAGGLPIEPPTLELYCVLKAQVGDRRHRPSDGDLIRLREAEVRLGLDQIAEEGATL